MGRRDSDDPKWQEVKKTVRERDRTDRVLRILSVKEVVQLKKIAPPWMLSKLDVCHVFPVSIYPDLVYCPNNCVLMNRYCHENLDNLRHPVSGTAIDYPERQAWWAKILGEAQWEKLLNQIDN